MSEKTSLATKVELQAALQTLDRALAMVQAARAQVFSLLHADEVRAIVQAQVPQIQAQVPQVQAQVPQVQAQVPQVQAQVPQVQAQVPQVQAQVPQALPAPTQQTLVAQSPQKTPAEAPAKHTGGYVHPRTRKDVFKEARNIGIPEVALTHYKLLKDGVKPTKEGFLATEDLIAKVKAAKAAGQDPTPLWAAYMPSAPPILT